jgi:transporter family-2 protein
MAILNGGLGRALGGAHWAALMLLLVGLTTCLCVAAVITWMAQSPVPNRASLTAIEPVQLLGGVIVAFYILSVTFLAPRIGVGNAILFIMVAQIVVSATIDHFGLFGAQLRPVGGVRVLGLAVLLLGLAITQLSAAAKP